MGLERIHGRLVDVDVSIAGDKQVIESIVIETDDTSRKSIPANQVILAMGPWTEKFVNETLSTRMSLATQKPSSEFLFPLMKPYKAHSTIHTDTFGAPASAIFAFIEGSESDLIDKEPEFFPRPDGTIYMCAYVDEETPLPNSAKEIVPNEDALEVMLNLTKRVHPELNESNLEKLQSCYIPMSVKEGPFIEKYPHLDNCWLSTGELISTI